MNDSESEAKNEKQGLDMNTNILKTKCVSVTPKQHFKLNS